MSIISPVIFERTVFKETIATVCGSNKLSSGSFPKFFMRIGVLVRSGLIQLILIFDAYHSSLNACIKLTTAALEEE